MIGRQIRPVVVSCLAALFGCKSVPQNATAEHPIQPLRAVATATAAARTKPNSEPPHTNVPAKTEKAAAVQRALAEMSAIRKLPVNRPVGGIVLDRTSMIAKLRAHVEREVPRSAIDREGQALQLLGVVPESFDYTEETFAMLKEQIAGFYETDDGNMYLADDLEGDAARVTLSHELVHALQDQSFNLKAQSSYHPGEGDLAFARSALAEGDATSAMFEPMLAPQGVDLLKIPDALLESMLQQTESTTPTHQLPPIMQASLTAPYTVGLRFVNQLRRRGGWDTVNSAWANPPTTSEQVLHVDKYDVHEAAMVVPTPTARALPGLQLVDVDTQGELGLRLLLTEWLGDKDAAIATAGDWGGDRMGHFERGSERALSMRVVFDNGQRGDSAATRFARIASALATSRGKPGKRTPGYLCLDRPKVGPLTIRSTPNGYVVTAGPANLTAGVWSTTMTCSDTALDKWSSELATR
jgi:hypothetical protein